MKLEEQAAKHKLRIKLRFAVVYMKFSFNTNWGSKKIRTTRHMHATDPIKETPKNRAVGSVAGSRGKKRYSPV